VVQQIYYTAIIINLWRQLSNDILYFASGYPLVQARRLTRAQTAHYTCYIQCVASCNKTDASARDAGAYIKPVTRSRWISLPVLCPVPTSCTDVTPARHVTYTGAAIYYELAAVTVVCSTKHCMWFRLHVTPIPKTNHSNLNE